MQLYLHLNLQGIKGSLRDLHFIRPRQRMLLPGVLLKLLQDRLRTSK